MITPNHHNIDKNFKLTHRIKSSIGTVYFYNKNILVVEINEGVELSYVRGAKLLLQVMLYLKSTPFVYISNRVQSYATVPTDYKYLDRIRSLKALSIVRSASDKLKPSPIETFFCTKEFELFHDLQEAMEWATSILRSQNEKILK